MTEITTEIDFVKMAEGIVKLQEGQKRLEEYIVGNDCTDGLSKRVKCLENGIPKFAGVFSVVGIFVGSALTWLFNFMSKR